MTYTCVHEVRQGKEILCDIDLQPCIGMIEGNEITDCGFCISKEELESRQYIESLSVEDIKKICEGNE